jgi:nicotinamidase-related amidase
MAARTALLLIDLINPFDYEGAEQVLRDVRAKLENTRALVARFRALDLPVIYVNDNFGRWRSSFQELIQHCADAKGREVIEALHPERSDYFVLKPHRSGFYITPLELLLSSLETQHLVLAGLTTDMCILATASDAQMRGYAITIARDCTSALSRERHERALILVAESCNAALRTSAEILASPDEHPELCEKKTRGASV